MTLKIQQDIGAMICIRPDAAFFIVTEGVRAVAWFNTKEDAELFMRAKGAEEEGRRADELNASFDADFPGDPVWVKECEERETLTRQIIQEYVPEGWKVNKGFNPPGQLTLIVFPVLNHFPGPDIKNIVIDERLGATSLNIADYTIAVKKLVDEQFGGQLARNARADLIGSFDQHVRAVPGDHKEGHAPFEPEESLPEPDVILEILPSQEGW